MFTHIPPKSFLLDFHEMELLVSTLSGEAAHQKEVCKVKTSTVYAWTSAGQMMVFMASFGRLPQIKNSKSVYLSIVGEQCHAPSSRHSEPATFWTPKTES